MGGCLREVHLLSTATPCLLLRQMACQWRNGSTQPFGFGKRAGSSAVPEHDCSAPSTGLLERNRLAGSWSAAPRMERWTGTTAERCYWDVPSQVGVSPCS